MSASARRRRAAVLLCLALACGGLAASEVSGRVGEVEARVGPMVPVLVARADLEEGTEIDPATAERTLDVREIPQRFAPADALSSAEEAAGLRTAIAIPAGAYVTIAGLGSGGAGPAGGGAALARGERAIELQVAGGEALDAAAGGPGARVDVLVSTEGEAGEGRTFLALENAELLALRAGEGSASPAPAGGEGASAGAGSSTIATLRVTLRQAVYLTAAQNFAREIRLLARAPGDRRRAGRASVDAGAL